MQLSTNKLVLRHLQERQTAFAVGCLRWLRQQHMRLRGPGMPWRAIVVGHSMGGIVARAALAELANDPGFGTSLAPCEVGQSGTVSMAILDKSHHHTIHTFIPCCCQICCPDRLLT